MSCPHVTLLVSAAFAQYWIVPHLTDLHTKHSVDLRIQACDRHVQVPDDGSTLAVRLGDGAWALSTISLRTVSRSKLAPRAPRPVASDRRARSSVRLPPVRRAERRSTARRGDTGDDRAPE